MLDDYHEDTTKYDNILKNIRNKNPQLNENQDLK